MTEMVFGLPVLVLLFCWLAPRAGFIILSVHKKIIAFQDVQMGRLETERELLLERILEERDTNS